VVHTSVNTADFVSYLLQATASGAKAIGVIEGGADLVTLLKQAQEFWVSESGQQIAVAFAQLSDIKALGLRLAHLMEVKTPAEPLSDWDYYKILRKVSGDQAFRPMPTSCPLVESK
jgi:hypothetical protein